MDQTERGAGEEGDRPVEGWVKLVTRFSLGLALALSLLQQTLLQSYRIAGNSMTPAFLDGDRVVVAAMPGFFGTPRRGEAVIARVNGEILIKRVAALPGETIALQHGLLCRDGVATDDPIPEGFRDSSDLAPVTLGPDQYFLLGDHRCVSIDSREFGPVARDAILGRVILRVPQAGRASPAASAGSTSGSRTAPPQRR